MVSFVYAVCIDNYSLTVYEWLGFQLSKFILLLREGIGISFPWFVDSKIMYGCFVMNGFKCYVTYGICHFL